MKRWIAVALAAVLVSGVVAGVRVMAQTTDDTRIIVAFQKNVATSDREKAVAEKNAKKVGEIYADSAIWVVESKEGKKDKQLVADFAKDKRVVYAEPDLELQITSLGNPNDALFTEEYSHQRINSVAGWTFYPGVYSSRGGPTIAVIDTGIDTNHPDLVGHIDTARSRCFGLLCFLTGYEDDNGHGTHVAGTAAAATNNGTGIAGVAFNTKIMALKVCNAGGTCSTSDVTSAINYARTNGAKVVSMSLGSSGSSTTLQTAVTNAWNAGLVLVAAAGNDGNATLNYPAAYQQVISVAATDANDRKASFSNANADVELAAPGVSVLAPYNDGGYRYLSGTSMATPHVAGLAALLFGQHPTWSNVMVRNQMDQCSDDLGAAGRDPSFGFGRINLGRALGVC